MKKQDLYDLIIKRFTKTVTSIREKYQDEAESMARGLFDTHKERFEKLANEIEKVKEATKGFDFNHFLYYHSYTSNVAGIIGQGRYDEAVLKALISEFRSLNEFFHFEQLNKEVVAVKRRYNQMLVKYRQEYKQAETLKTELNTIVKLSSNAKQAAEKLEKLGLDLSDIEEVVANNLPAVLTTSVSVELFNKTV